MATYVMKNGKLVQASTYSPAGNVNKVTNSGAKVIGNGTTHTQNDTAYFASKGMSAAPGQKTVASNAPAATANKTVAKSTAKAPASSVNYGGYSNYGYNPYQESQSVIDARNAMNAHNANRVEDWTGGTYGDSLRSAMDKILNRDKFSYDLNGDALYQQYKDQYTNLGRVAMQDSMAQASALTGGYGNSYAATVGNQAYQSYLGQLNDKVPELYQMAMDAYNREGQDMYNQYSMIADQYNNEYGQYRDRVNDWNNEAQRLATDYYNAANMDYSRYTDNRDYQTSLGQYAQEMALKQDQLAENIRSNQASEAYNLAKATASANTSQGEKSAEENEVYTPGTMNTDAYYNKNAKKNAGLGTKEGSNFVSIKKTLRRYLRRAERSIT